MPAKKQEKRSGRKAGNEKSSSLIKRNHSRTGKKSFTQMDERRFHRGPGERNAGENRHRSKIQLTRHMASPKRRGSADCLTNQQPGSLATKAEKKIRRAIITGRALGHDVAGSTYCAPPVSLRRMSRRSRCLPIRRRDGGDRDEARQIMVYTIIWAKMASTPIVPSKASAVRCQSVTGYSARSGGKRPKPAAERHILSVTVVERGRRSGWVEESPWR